MAYKLYELVKILRSRNAGLCTMTVDIFFDDWNKYQLVKKAITKDLMAKIYKKPVKDIEIHTWDEVMGIKVTIPRSIPKGYPGTRDIDGTQFYIPLRVIEIPSN